MNSLLSRKRAKSRVVGKSKTVKAEKARLNVLDPFSTELPPCVADTCHYLEAHGLSEEGVFRVPGFMTEVRELKAQYDRGLRPNLAETKGIHTVGSLLKHFLAELSEPLLTFELIDCFMLAADVSTAGGGEEAKVEVNLNAIKSCLRLLPPANMAVLDRITSLFVKITANSEKNNMTAPNIATCLSPVIMRREEDPSDVQVFLEESKKIHSLITTLIEQYELLFDKKANDTGASASPSRAGSDERLNAALRRGSMKLASSLIRKERERSESLQNACLREELTAKFFGSDGGDGGERAGEDSEEEEERVVEGQGGTPSRGGRAVTSQTFLKPPLGTPDRARGGEGGTASNERWKLMQKTAPASSVALTPSPNREVHRKREREPLASSLDEREALAELELLTAEAEKLEEEERRIEREQEVEQAKREEARRKRVAENERKAAVLQKEKEALKVQEKELQRQQEEVLQDEAKEKDRRKRENMEREEEKTRRKLADQREEREKRDVEAEAMVELAAKKTTSGCGAVDPRTMGGSKWKAGDFKRGSTGSNSYSSPTAGAEARRSSFSLSLSQPPPPSPPAVEVATSIGGLKIVRRSSGRVDSVSVDESSAPEAQLSGGPGQKKATEKAAPSMSFVSAGGGSLPVRSRSPLPISQHVRGKRGAGAGGAGVQQVSQILSQDSPRPLRAGARGRGRGRARGVAGDARGVGLSPMRPRSPRGRGRGIDARGRGMDARGRGMDARGRGGHEEQKATKRILETDEKPREKELEEEEAEPPKRKPRKFTPAHVNGSASSRGAEKDRQTDNFVGKKEERESSEEVEALAQLLMAGNMRDASVLVQQQYVVPDGYSGDLKNGRPHGKGTLVFPNNDLYRGDFLDGQRHGMGELLLSNGDTYKGEFVNGVRHGKGVYIDGKGNKYSGEYVHGKRCGQGVQLYSSGIIYEGEFREGRANGKGKTIYKNQDEYVGWHKDNQPHGRGHFKGKNGGRYEGFYKLGLRHGKGCLLSVSGNKFTGEFSENTMHGYGRYEFTTGDVYEGEFVSGKFCGLGRYSFGPDQSTSMIGRFEGGQCVEELEFDVEKLLLRVERAKDLSIVPDNVPTDVLSQEAGMAESSAS